MKIQAKLHAILNPQSGNGKNGSWKKQDIILEYGDKFVKKVCVTIWGEKLQVNSFKLGDALIVDFDLESKAYNGKWYTELKAWKIELHDFNLPVTQNQEITPLRISMTDDLDILPF